MGDVPNLRRVIATKSQRGVWAYRGTLDILAGKANPITHRRFQE